MQPRLIDTVVPARPRGAVLVLHGGGSRPGRMMVSPTQLSVLRMIPIAKRIAHAGGGELAVFRLLNSVRGWDAHRTPVADAAWALDQLAERLGELPVCLVGHSLGGRAALLAGERPEVRSVVALAPWVYPTDAVGGLAGRRVLFAHGDQDRIASPGRAATVARNLAANAEVAYVRVTGGKHAMLRRRACFDGLAADFATATLLGDGREPDRDGALARIAAGERWFDV
jgi:pimeloyl-ACP methyl ester carboxylesterase